MVWWMVRASHYIGGKQLDGRVVDIDDLRDIVKYIEKITEGAVELTLTGGPRAIDQLENLSDYELSRATIETTARFGPASPDPKVQVALRRWGGSGVHASGDPKLEQQVYDFISEQSKPWYNVRHLLAVASPLIVLVTAGLVLWWAIDIELDARLWLPAALGSAVVAAAALRASKAIDGRLVQSRSGVKIYPESRRTLRERRWNRWRDIWVALGGLAAGVALTLLGVLIRRG